MALSCWCPVRRLAILSSYQAMAELVEPHEIAVISRSLLVEAPLLHEHLRLLYPRPGGRHRHGVKVANPNLSVW